MVHLPKDETNLILTTETTADNAHSRRDFLKQSAAAAGAGLLGGGIMSLSSSAWAAGSDKPEKTEVKVGFIPFHKTYQNLLIVEQIGFVFTSCFNKIAQRDTLGFRYKTPQMRGFTALSQHHTPLGLTFFPQALRLVELTIGIYSINRMNAPLK